MKRRLSGADREGVHGEFGIGLLSFWSLGDELHIASAARDGRMHELTLQRGQRRYTIRPVRGEMPAGGTRVIVGPLLDATRTIVTGEKLQRYLAVELRDRIRNTGVEIRIADRVSRKQLVVVPREFDGDRLDLPQTLATPHGDVHVELYIRGAPAPSTETGIAVCKDGTRVLRHASELDALQQPPWTDGRLEGVFDFPTFTLAPGTRSGIVPDERLAAFIAAVTGLGPAVQAAIEQWDQAESDKASRQILRQVHRALVNALRELPANEYLFFDLPRDRPGPEETERSPGTAAPAASARAAYAPESDAEPQPVLFPTPPGPLASVHVRPHSARRNVGDECALTAVARDEHGQTIPDGVGFRWEIREGEASLTGEDGPRCRVTSDQPGRVVVQVAAEQDVCRATAEAVVKFFSGHSTDPDDDNKGLPTYRLEAARGASWRSRYDVAANEIVINSTHRDFLASKQTAAKHRRYVGKLYAKEVVLINFPHESPAEVMERLIEVLIRTEDAL
jgi:hypothetical protein